MNRVSNRDASSRNNNNNRQRNRGRSNNNNNNNNRRGPNPLQRSYESNGPDVKIRGNAMQVAEKYLTLARDAQVAGDRVLAENYMQHAEHYTRIIAAAQAANQQTQQAAQQAQENQPQPSVAPSAPAESNEHVVGAGPQPIIEQPQAEATRRSPNTAVEDGKSAEPVVASAFEHSSIPEPVAVVGETKEAIAPKPRRARRPKAVTKPSDAGENETTAEVVPEKPVRKPRIRRPKVTADVAPQPDAAE
ncbi:MAG: DUF4167 domain-containing protein [Hyphomicrobiales bacterium]